MTRAIPHVLVKEQPGCSLMRASPVRKCVRWASHGFDGKAAPVDIGEMVTAENHQVGIALVDPERDSYCAVRISEFDTSDTTLVPFKVGERMVEPSRTEPPRMLEIVVRALYGLRADRNTALVKPQYSSRR